MAPGFLINEDDTEENVVQVSGTGANAQLTFWAKTVCANIWFDKAVITVIVLNAGWIGVDVDWNNGPHGTVKPIVFTIVENVFCSLFTLELLLRFCTYEIKSDFYKDPKDWKSNMFDCGLVGLMILEVWILEFLTAGINLHQFSLIRLLRLMRLLRISRIFRMVPELGMMVKCLTEAARSVSSALVLEVGVMYVFAVILTQWAKDHDDKCYKKYGFDEDGSCFLDELFGSIPKSLVTLLQILVFDDTFSIIRPVLDDSWYMGALLIAFIVIGSWTVLNMLIGIICEIICTGTAEEKMRILEFRVREVFASIDLDGSGTVSRAEFSRGGAQGQLVKLGISRDIVRSAFDILDCDGSGHFDVDEFMRMVFKLLNPPQSQDIQALSQKISDIAGHIHVQAFQTSTSSKSFRGSGSGSGFMKPASRGSNNGDEWKLESSNAFKEGPAVAEFDEDEDEVVPFVRILGEEASSAPTLRRASHAHTAPSFSGNERAKDNGNERAKDNGMRAKQQSDQIVKVHDHPVPEEMDAKTMEPPGHPDYMEDQIMADYGSEHERQAQEIFERLQQLSQSAEKVEEALQLVHRTKLWETSTVGSSDEKVDNNGKVDSILWKAGLGELPPNDKAEARGLLQQYIALDQDKYLLQQYIALDQDKDQDQEMRQQNTWVNSAQMDPNQLPRFAVNRPPSPPSITSINRDRRTILE